MSDVLMVGCDLHDRTMMLKSCVGRDGAVRTRTVPNDRGSRRILRELLKSEAAAAGAEKIVFAYEASGQGFGLYDQLREGGIECHVLAPTKMAKTPGERKRKTDDRDAEKILDLVRAFVLAGTSLPTVWVPGLQTRDDREAVRQRVTVADKRCQVKTQVQSLLKRCDLRKPVEVKASWTKAFESWLRQLADGRMADGSPSPLGSGARHALSSLLRELQFWDEELSRLDEAVQELARSERYESAVREQTQEDGVGVLTSLVFLSELGDVTRFSNRRQVGAYLGLAPSCFESGNSDDRKGHITRQGPGRVRKLLCQACWVAVRVNPTERKRYETLKARNPNKPKIAIVAAMRRLAIRLWHKANPPLVEESVKQKSLKEKSVKQKSVKQKSVKQKSMKQKSMKSKSTKEKSFKQESVSMKEKSSKPKSFQQKSLNQESLKEKPMGSSREPNGKGVFLRHGRAHE